MAEASLPPQQSVRMMSLSAAGGGFGGALLAILIAKLLANPCCCGNPNGVAALDAQDNPAVLVAERQQVSN